MNKITVQKRQSLSDICLQELGSMDAIFDFINANDGINSIDHKFSAGDLVVIPDSTFKNELIVRKYSSSSIKLANDFPNDLVGPDGDYNGDYNDDYNNQ